MRDLFRQFNKTVSKEDAAWGWLGQRGHDSVGIDTLIPIQFILSCDYGSDIEQMKKRSLVFSVEKYKKKSLYVRNKWSNQNLEEMFRGRFGKQVKKYFSAQKKRINLICYRSLDILEDMERKNPERIRILAPPLRLKNLFDNKIYLRNHILPSLKLKKIPGETSNLKNLSYGNLLRKWGHRFVIQFAYGSSGDHTFIVKTKEELLKIKHSFPPQDVNITRYIDAIPININACILHYPKRPEVITSFPSIQIVGAPESTYYPTIYCGNDYGAMRGVDRAIIKRVYDTTKRIGLFMASFGFKGIFGLDFLIYRGYPYVIEINPRMQNSTQLLTICQLKKGILPLVALHIMEFVNYRLAIEKLRRLEQRLISPLEGAQIILYNRSGKRLRVNNVVQGGRYRLTNGAIDFINRDGMIKGHNKNGEFWVASAIPGLHHLIEKGGTLFKIQTIDEVMDKTCKNLNPRYSRIVKEVYRLTDNSF